MNKFIVKIAFKNGKHKTITGVCSLNYGAEFINGEWTLTLDIAKNIDSKPEYFKYKSFMIDKILILKE